MHNWHAAQQRCPSAPQNTTQPTQHSSHAAAQQIAPHSVYTSTEAMHQHIRMTLTQFTRAQQPCASREACASNEKHRHSSHAPVLQAAPEQQPCTSTARRPSYNQTAQRHAQLQQEPLRTIHTSTAAMRQPVLSTGGSTSHKRWAHSSHAAAQQEAPHTFSTSTAGSTSHNQCAHSSHAPARQPCACTAGHPSHN